MFLDKPSFTWSFSKSASFPYNLILEVLFDSVDYNMNVASLGLEGTREL